MRLKLKFAKSVSVIKEEDQETEEEDSQSEEVDSQSEEKQEIEIRESLDLEKTEDKTAAKAEPEIEIIDTSSKPAVIEEETKDQPAD